MAPTSPNITSADDLLRLAPDPKTLEAGRRLFYSKRWRLVGGDGRWLWGEFQFGKGNKASETAVELTTGRFYCSCRGRQRPCAHGLALVLILKNDQERITVGQPPSWVRSVQHRASHPAPPTKDTLAAADRQGERITLMSAGVNELELRLLDITRRGIADTLAQGVEPLLAAAARLTDAKLPGPAGAFRRLAALGAEGSEADFARTLGDLYLFTRAWKNREGLPAPKYQELQQFAGLNPKKDTILSQAGVEDHWLVLGVVEGAEERLRFRRIWLRGERTRRFALILDYAFGERPFERAWPLGASFQGAVFYYPGSYPQRALFPFPGPGGRPYDGLVGYRSLDRLALNYRKALSLNPWLFSYPVYLTGFTPRLTKQRLALISAEGAVMPVGSNYVGSYSLLAVGGGGPVDCFGEFNGRSFQPLSIMDGGGVLPAE